MTKSTTRRLAQKAAGLLVLSTLSIDILAGSGGSITYGPLASTPVPALSSTMLVLLSVALAAVGYVVMKNKARNAGRMMVLSLIGVGILLSAAGGVKLVNDSYATSVGFSNPNGGTVSFSSFSGELSFSNDTGVLTRIISVTKPDDNCVYQEVQVPECADGLVLSTGEACYINCGGGQG